MIKRLDLLKWLQAQGAELLREGGAHTVFIHRANQRSSTVPRHKEINDFLARKICKDLDIASPFNDKK